MRLLVCGSRDWSNRRFLYQFLDEYHAQHPVTVLVEGEAAGADTMSREWAESKGIVVEKYPADWTKYGKAAGPIRNSQMLQEGKPEAVIAFSLNLETSRGTKNMVAQAIKAGVPTIDAVSLITELKRKSLLN